MTAIQKDTNPKGTKNLREREKTRRDAAEQKTTVVTTEPTETPPLALL